MTDAQNFKKLASDMCILLPAVVDTLSCACDALSKQASANVELEKRASAAEAREIKLDEAKLLKAANAVSKLFGGTMSGSDLYAVYKTNPNAIIDSLAKTASHQIGKTVTTGLGVIKDMSKEPAKLNKDMSPGDVYSSLRSKRY